MAFLQEVVREVVPVPRLTPLPEAPDWAPGLLNLRGVLVPIIDVQARVTGEPRRVALSDLIVVTGVGGRPVGFLVQEIVDLKRCPGIHVERPRDIPAADYLMGVVQVEGASVLVLSAVALARSFGVPELPEA